MTYAVYHVTVANTPKHEAWELFGINPHILNKPKIYSTCLEYHHVDKKELTWDELAVIVGLYKSKTQARKAGGWGASLVPGGYTEFRRGMNVFYVYNAPYSLKEKIRDIQKEKDVLEYFRVALALLKNFIKYEIIMRANYVKLLLNNYIKR